MPLFPVEQNRQTLAETVHDRLLEAILDGELPAGAPLVQERLAESLGVSRQPVLQALAMLKRGGFVEAADRRGYRVTDLAPEMVADVYELRGALDRVAAGAAARRAAPDRERRLDAALAAGEAALARGDTARLVAADAAFHQTIYDLSGNALIAEAAAQPWRHIRRAMAAVLRDEPGRATVWREHRAIAAAIRAGDPAAAEKAASAHAAHAADRIGGRVAQAGADTDAPGDKAAAAASAP
jgi:DNA-binding GntR family transcriptional regulator